MITLPAYAKINLSLDIVGVRNDGYHLLKTVMQSVSLCDTVSVFLTDHEITLSCDDKSLPYNMTNTACKAAKAFFDFLSIQKGAEIAIKKAIPYEAGMGGASADAAAVILALNQLTGANLSKGKLLKIGLTVGADVPFCLTGGTALCEGIGEKITKLSDIPDCFIVIAKPQSGISTKSAYDAYDSGIVSGTLYTDSLLCKYDDLNNITDNLGNIFEELCANPEIDIIKLQMKSAGALGACMTGSGSAVFGIFDNEQKALFCQTELAEDYPFTAVCKPQKGLE